MSVNRQVVVVGYDGSDTSKAAVAYGSRRAGHDGLVVLVHVPPSGAVGEAVFEGAVEEIVSGTQFDTRVAHGQPARALVEAARDYGAFEIVVGARSLGFVRNGLGSVAGSLLREADRPVTVVPPGFDPAYQIAA